MVQIFLFAHKSCKLMLLQNSQDWRKVWGKKLFTPNVKVRRRNGIGKAMNRKTNKQTKKLYSLKKQWQTHSIAWTVD